MRRKPIIGITGYHVRGEEGFGGKLRGVAGQGFDVFGHDYINAVKKLGGIPIGIPVGDLSTCNDVLQAVDGLILSGGDDIDPSLYGSHPDMRCWTIVPERDRFELQLLKDALSSGKPILAICRGMQLVNVYFGGTLYVDLSDISENVLAHQFMRCPRWHLTHEVSLKSPLFQELYQANRIKTNTYHHQAVKELGAGLEIAAVADDGVVEGLVHPDYPNLLAVQWHPEMMAVELEEGLVPFRWLFHQIEENRRQLI